MESPRKKLLSPQRNLFLALLILPVVGILILSVVALTIGEARPFETKGTGIFSAQPIWSYESQDNIISTPVVEHAKVYIRTSVGVRVLNELTGKLMHTINIPGIATETRPPIIGNDILFVPATQSQLIAYQLEPLTPFWKACPRNTNCTSPEGFEAIGTIIYSEDVLVVTRYSGAITAYDAETGRTIWDENIEGHDYPYIDANGSTLYVAKTNSLDAYDIHTGTRKWSSPSSLMGRILIKDDLLYAVTGSGQDTIVEALSLSSKQVIWKVVITTAQPIAFTYLTMDQTNLIVASDSLIAIDSATGAIKWENKQYQKLEQPIIGGTIVFVRTAGHDLFSFDLATGKQLGQLSLQNDAPRTNEVMVNPATIDGLLIVPIGSYHVVAFDLK